MPERPDYEALKVEQSLAPEAERPSTAQAEPPKTPMLTESEKEELAASRDALVIKEMKERGERAADMQYMRQRFETEPRDQKIHRMEAEIAYGKEIEAGIAYTESRKSSRNEPTRPKEKEVVTRGPEKEITDAAALKSEIAQMREEAAALEIQITLRIEASNGRTGRS
jgi:hypothetical protein